MSAKRLTVPVLAVFSTLCSHSMAVFPVIFPDPIALNTNAVGDSGNDHTPRIATDGKGHWVAIWNSNDTLGGTIGMDSDILFARSENNGASWSTPAPLNINAASDGSGSDNHPIIATDSLGTWIVVWQSTTNLGGAIGTDSDILYARSTDNGMSWSLPAPLNTNAAIDAVSDFSPQISTDSQGHWVAVWGSAINMTGPGSDADIFVATSNNAGVTWTPPVPLNTNATTDTGSDGEPLLASDGQGNWLVVWRSSENLGGTIGTDDDFFFARSIDNGASWTPPAVLNNNAATDTRGGGDLTLATDGQGNWMVAWTSTENLGGVLGTDGDIQFTRSTDNGTTWTDPMPLNNNAAGDLGADEIPSIVTDGSGNWIATWDGNNAAGGSVGTEYDIFIAHSADNGETWTNPVPLNTTANTDIKDDYFAIVCSDKRGNWVAAWESAENVGGQIGTDYDILTFRFAFPDCNANGIGDLQDIADGTSADCNANGIPDSCELDSDGDGVIDACTTGAPTQPSPACGTCAPGVFPAVGLFTPIVLEGWARRRRPAKRTPMRGNQTTTKCREMGMGSKCALLWAAVLVSGVASHVSAQPVRLQVGSRNTDSVLRYNGMTGDFIDTFVPAGAGAMTLILTAFAMLIIHGSRLQRVHAPRLPEDEQIKRRGGKTMTRFPQSILILFVMAHFAATARGQFPAVISPPAALNTTATTDTAEDTEFNVRVASDRQGSWLAVWTIDAKPGPDLFGDILFARSTDNGMNWTAPAPLNSNPGANTPDDEEPQIVTDGQGTWLVVWESFQFLGMDSDIAFSRSTDNGATWSFIAPLNTNAATDTGNDSYPQLATDDNGNWIVVWQSTENLGNAIGTDEDILVARSADNGATWTPPAPLNTNAGADTGSDEDVRIATDANGTWLAVWSAGKFAGVDKDILFARSQDDGATWTVPAPVNTDAATDSGSDYDAYVSTDRQGNWIVAWGSLKDASGSLGSDGDIVVSRSSDNGASWTAAVPLNNNAATDAGLDEAILITTDRVGHWVAVWRSAADIGGNISGNNDADMLVSHSPDNGLTWTNPALLNINGATDTTGVEYEPIVATDGQGNWIGAWDSFDTLGGTTGGEGDIFNVRFAFPDCNGNGIGDRQDIADGTSADCNANGVPDSCEVDSDADGIIDACAAPGPAPACGTCAPGVFPLPVLIVSALLVAHRRRRQLRTATRVS